MRYALISVSDKRGAVDLARELVDLGFGLISSGGTASALRDKGIAVTEVAEFTGAPEILGGRVKTLHPRVYGAILARPTADHLAELALHSIPLIEIVVCNLYPFEDTVQKLGVTSAEAIENIDIGGVTLIRAAAKNYERVLLLCDPDDYAEAIAKLKNGSLDVAFKQKMAIKGFKRTATYDQAIYNHFANLE